MTVIRTLQNAEPSSEAGSHQQAQAQAQLAEGPLSSGVSAATAVNDASFKDSALKVSLPSKQRSGFLT